MDTQVVDIIYECKVLKRLRKHIDSPQDMNARERAFYEERLALSKLKYKNIDVWGKIMLDRAKFKNPQIIGS